MKTVIPWILALLLIASSCPAAEDVLPTVLPASEFNLEAYRGQVVLLDFWASWCAPCKHSLPWLSSMQEQYGEQGLQVVAVNLDDKLEAAEGMLASLHTGIQVFHDPKGKLAEKFQLEGMPSAYLHDRTGKLQACHVGFLPAECEDKEAQIRKLLAQEYTDDIK